MDEIKKYLPSHISLYDVYGNDLSSQLGIAQRCISENSIDALTEVFYPEDFCFDSLEYYLSEIKKSMKKDGKEELFCQKREEIEEYLRDHDESDPYNAILANTKLTCFYDLGLELDHGWHEAVLCEPWCNDSVDNVAYKVRRKLGILKGTPEADKIQTMCCQANGGMLRIYFRSNIKDLLSSQENDYKSIHFKGKVAVAVYNPFEGSGDFCVIKIDKLFPFLRDNLSISKSEKYHLENCFGLCGSWLDKCTTPELLYKSSHRKIAKSQTSELRKQEEEYKKTFAAGGCTAGDMDMKRHREVYYTNEFPCGWRCPHCGTFWVD